VALNQFMGAGISSSDMSASDADGRNSPNSSSTAVSQNNELILRTYLKMIKRKVLKDDVTRN
jgi:hypothetical protein